MPTISTIATSQQSLNMRQVIARQSTEQNTLAQEAASGLKQDIYSESPGQGAQALSIRANMAATQAYLDSNNLLEGKLEIMSEALGQISTIAGDFQNLTLTDSMPSQSPAAYQVQAQNTLEGIVDALNLSHNGAYLFSGLATDQQPVEVDPGGASVTYLGDTSGTQSAMISDSLKMTYGISANDPAFNDIFEALGEVISADFTTMDETDIDNLLADVTTKMNSGLEGLLALQTKTGNNQALLSDKIEENQSYLTVYNNAINDIESADPEETALRLNEVTPAA